MKSNLKTFLVAFVAALFIGSINHVNADETSTKETVKEAASDSKRAMKKGARKGSDKVCEMVNGKMKCIGKKMKHAAQNTGDKIEDTVD